MNLLLGTLLLVLALLALLLAFSRVRDAYIFYSKGLTGPFFMALVLTVVMVAAAAMFAEWGSGLAGWDSLHDSIAGDPVCTVSTTSYHSEAPDVPTATAPTTSTTTTCATGN